MEDALTLSSALEQIKKEDKEINHLIYACVKADKIFLEYLFYIC